MPNYCECDLYISGDEKNIRRLLNHIKGAKNDKQDFDFNTVIPYPEVYAARDRDMSELTKEQFQGKYGASLGDGYNNGGYEWCIRNWGTKWNSCDVSLEIKEYRTRLSFSTAWSPPYPIILKLHELFPECTLAFEYYEKGTQVCGGFTCLGTDEYGDEANEQDGRVDEWQCKEYLGERGG